LSRLADGRAVIAVATPLPQASTAVANYPGSDGTLHENAYLLGPTGQLYVDVYDGGNWSWANLSTEGVPLAGTPAVSNFPSSDGTLHENVYVLGSDGNLYLDVYDGGSWSWVNLGNGGVSLSSTLGVINYPGSDGTLHENVFVQGADGNLYLDAYDGGVWKWVNLGSPGHG
jgi:hypothetical protein